MPERNIYDQAMKLNVLTCSNDVHAKKKRKLGRLFVHFADGRYSFVL